LTLVAPSSPEEAALKFVADIAGEDAEIPDAPGCIEEESEEISLNASDEACMFELFFAYLSGD